MLRLLLNQKINGKNNHYLAYTDSNISEEMEFGSFYDKNNNISDSIFKESWFFVSYGNFSN